MSAAGAARRRFTRAGLGASGVILTLVSQPGMAQTVCAAPSGSLSQGPNSRTVNEVVCAGRSPGYWKTHFPDQLMMTPLARRASVDAMPTSPLFGSVFPCNANRANFRDTQLHVMLDHQEFDQHNLGMHLVAAWLNATYGMTSFLKPADVVAIWSEWQLTEVYHPTATVSWDAVEIVKYLTRTMG